MPSSIRGKGGIACVAAILLTAVETAACPLCSTATGATVRQGIFNAEFVVTASTVLLPFPVILGVVAVLRYGWNPRPLLERIFPALVNEHERRCR